MIIKVQDRIQVNSDERVAINLGAERYTTRQHTDKLEVAYSDSFQVVPFAKRITVDYTMPSSMLDGFITDIDALRADILHEIGAREVAIIDSTSYNKTYVDGKVKQTYLDVKANYIGNEQAEAYILDTEIADMEITYDTGSGNTIATFQGLNDTVIAVENSQASYTEDLQVVVDNVSANAEYITTLAAEAGGIAASVISTEGVSVGDMHTWDGDEVLKVGYLYDFGEGTMQYLGGMLGDDNDGWVKYNSTIHKVLSDSMASESLVTAGLIEELQHQIGGNIVTLFNDGAPEFLSGDALYLSDAGSKGVVTDDFVWSTSAVQMFKYIGADATIDLSTVNYLTDSDWLAIYKISPAENAWFSADGIDTSNDYYWYDSDGKIAPLTDADTPAVSTERVRHIGDLYYDKLTGYAYRFAYEDIMDSPDKGIIYSWIIITDIDITKALSDAAKAQDTADGKRMIFNLDSVPTDIVGANSYTVKIDTGDLWIPNGDVAEDGVTYKDGRIYSYVKGHTPLWVEVANYKDAVNEVQTDLNDWRNGDYSEFVTAIQTQADMKSSSYYQEGMPHNEGTNEEYSEWVGDLWKKPSDNNEYVYQLVDSTYKWVLTDVPDIVYSTIDTKKTIYTGNVAPTGTIANNDMWITGNSPENSEYSAGEIYIYNGSTWVVGTKFSENLTDFVSGINASVSALENQLDGKIEYWFLLSTATDPADSWTTAEERQRHHRDIKYFTDTKNGYSYNSTTASWESMSEDELRPIEAYYTASDARTIAAGKRTVYYLDNPPTSGILEGDLNVNPTTKVTTVWDNDENGWVDITTTATNNIIARVDGIDTTLGQHALDIADNDGAISDEEAARIAAINDEAASRAQDIADRIASEAALDNRIDDTEQAQIDSAAALTAAYENYSNTVTKAMADGALTDEERALISEAQDDIDTSLTNLQTATDIANEAHGWAGSASKLIGPTDANGKLIGPITGWSFAGAGDDPDTNQTSEFAIHANHFYIQNSDSGFTEDKYRPFEIDGTDIAFRGKVTFNSISDASTNIPTISSVDTAATTASWSNITGSGRPVDNADVTSENTSADTAAVNGTSASALVETSNTAHSTAKTANSTSNAALVSHVFTEGTTTIEGGNITTDSITAAQVVAGTITANKIQAGHIGTAISAIGSVVLDSAYAFADTIGENATKVVSVSYANTANTAVKILITCLGRTGFSNTAENNMGSTSIGIFTNSTLLADGGWTPAWQDSKAISTVVSIPANTTVIYDLLATKANDQSPDDYDESCTMSLNIIGVADGQ